jgi:hypothetical protein
MNMKILIAVGVPFLTAVASDLRRFANARKDAAAAGKSAPDFDWAVAGANWLDGAIGGLIAGLGVSAVS